MRALVFDGSNVRLDAAHPAPAAQPGEAVIRLSKGAVSALDGELAQGLLGFRGVLGHQFVGMVESVNSNNGQASHLIGKRVVGSITTVCGKCDMCVAGLSAHCRIRTIMGLSGRGGCLAERFALPAKNLLPVPDAIDNDHAVFAVELAAALQAAGQLTITGKPYITILGDSSLGLLTAQVMAKLNASVRLVGSHAQRLAICEKWSIKHRHADEIGRRADQDIVVECTGTREGLALAMQLVRPRGKILLKSLFAPNGSLLNVQRSTSHTQRSIADNGTIDLSPLVLNEIEMIGSFCGPMAEALTVLARRQVDVVSLISRRMSLNDGAAILKAASAPGAIKSLVDT